MDTIVRVPSDHLIVVCDARKALLLRNAGPVAQPDLEIIGQLDAEAQTDTVLDADRPGRRSDGGAHAASGGQRSAMETVDVGDTLAAAFADKLVEHLASQNRQSPFAGLIIAAPPAFLGLLRKGLKDALEGVPTTEIAKHLSEQPLPEIQKTLLQNLS